jgi:hypothetical protein
MAMFAVQAGEALDAVSRAQWAMLVELRRPKSDSSVEGKDCSRGFTWEQDAVGNWTRGPACYILAKNLSTFGPCPETLSEAEFKRKGQINLTA